MIKKLFSLVLIILPQLLLGQFYESDEIHRRIVFTQSDSVFETTILQTKVSKISINSNLDYYWYDNNRIHCNQGGFSGWLLDGECRIYTLDEHALIESGWFKAGLKEGEWKRWDKNGKLKERTNWRKGVIDGERFIYKNGSINVLEEYNNGVLDGVVKVFNSDGTTTEKHYTDGTEKVKEAKDPSKGKEKRGILRTNRNSVERGGKQDERKKAKGSDKVSKKTDDQG